MDNSVAKVATTPDPTYGQAPSTRPDAGTSSEAVPGQDPVDLRLVIEEDKASGSYVYKTVNRLTGEVLLQFPRDDVLRMREHRDYQAGLLISTKA